MAGSAFKEFVRAGALAYLRGGSPSKALLVGACAAVGAAVFAPGPADAHWQRGASAPAQTQSTRSWSANGGARTWNGSGRWTRPANNAVVVTAPTTQYNSGVYNSGIYNNAYQTVAPMTAVPMVAASPQCAGVGQLYPTAQYGCPQLSAVPGPVPGLNVDGYASAPLAAMPYGAPPTAAAGAVVETNLLAMATEAARAAGVPARTLIAIHRIGRRASAGFPPGGPISGPYGYPAARWLQALHDAAPRIQAPALRALAAQIQRGADGRYEVADPALRARILSGRDDAAVASMVTALTLADDVRLLNGRTGRTPFSLLYVGHVAGPEAMLAVAAAPAATPLDRVLGGAIQRDLQALAGVPGGTLAIGRFAAALDRRVASEPALDDEAMESYAMAPDAAVPPAAIDAAPSGLGAGGYAPRTVPVIPPAFDPAQAPQDADGASFDAAIGRMPKF